MTAFAPLCIKEVLLLLEFGDLLNQQVVLPDDLRDGWVADRRLSILRVAPAGLYLLFVLLQLDLEVR